MTLLHIFLRVYRNRSNNGNEKQRTDDHLPLCFDMDALDINEAEDKGHFPTREGFRSKVSGKMHACGHDAHIAIGLGYLNC